MKDPRGNRTLPTYRIDMWTRDGNAIAETFAYVSDLEIATTVFWYYAKKHAGEEVTLRQGSNVIRSTKNR